MSGYDKILDNAVTKNVADSITEQLSERQRNILIEIGIGGTNVTNNVTNTTDDIAALLGVSKRTILRDLEKMKELGIIVRVGTSKSGYWEIVKKKRMSSETRLTTIIRVSLRMLESRRARCLPC